jgi:tRNA-dihydrouridine synthase
MMEVDDEETMQIVSEHSSLKEFAEHLKIDCIPLIYSGEIKSTDEIKELLNRESYLGKAKIEGVVIKNYNQKLIVGGIEFPVMSGKYVSEEFKEVMKMHTGNKSNPWVEFKHSYKTEARFDKAYQHLKEDGLITESPKDIGILIKEVMADVEAEEKENITNFLWSFFGKDLLKTVADGVPMWYKNKLLESSIETE